MFPDDYFSNMEISGEEELSSYLPKFWLEIWEMQANNKFAGYTIDRMAKEIDILVKDRFFDSCTMEKLYDYESFLKIQSETAGMSIEDRRTQVKMKWNGDGKMTGRRIKEIVKGCLGCDCTVEFGSSDIIIQMSLQDNAILYIKMLRDILCNSNIPAHLGIVFHNALSVSGSLSMYHVGVPCLSESIEIPEVEV